MVHQIAPSAFKMKKGGGHIFQLSLICTLKAIEVIKKVKKRKKDWVTGLRHLNTLCSCWKENLLLELEGVRIADRGEGYWSELGKVKRRLEAEGLIHDCLVCAIFATASHEKRAN